MTTKRTWTPKTIFLDWMELVETPLMGNGHSLNDALDQLTIADLQKLLDIVIAYQVMDGLDNEQYAQILSEEVTDLMDRSCGR